nr:MAG TPA: putative periplasmic lipoprotein [Bacteriophage sp.]
MGVASGMEFKDKEYGNQWDWLDWAATILGGMVG